MSKPGRTETLPDNLLDHQAVRAWAALKPGRVEPDGIEILKLRDKSAVYRLGGVGPDGSAVIAKRCRRPACLVERIIYERLFARQLVPALRWYGFLDEPDNVHSWLFLEDAGTGTYLPPCAEHRALAGRWLGTTHAAAAREQRLELELPDRSPVHFLKRLQVSREELVRHFENPALREDGIRMLKALVGDLDVLEGHWSEVEKVCQDERRTIVHGDFVIKNVRVRTTVGSTSLLVFDWENAGWGVPCTDLAQLTDRTVSPDLDSYASALRGSWLRVSDVRVRELAECGRFFRLVDEIGWESPLLTFGPCRFVVKPASRLRVYQGQLHQALLAGGWAQGQNRPEASGLRQRSCGQARHRKTWLRNSRGSSRATVKLARRRRRTGYHG